MKKRHSGFFRYEEIAIQPRFSSQIGGIDYGATGKILVEVREGSSVKYRMTWIKGHNHASCGVRGFGQEYIPARMTISDKSGLSFVEVFQGGRLTKKRILEHQNKINEALGQDVATLIDPTKTLIITH